VEDAARLTDEALQEQQMDAAPPVEDHCAKRPRISRYPCPNITRYESCMMISGLDTLRTASEIHFMLGAYRTPNMGPLLFLLEYGVIFIPDTVYDHMPYSENNSNPCLKYLIRNGQLSFLEMILNSYPMSRYCTDMTTIHISSPNTRSILNPYIVLI
jgi:hypothetical protein